MRSDDQHETPKSQQPIVNSRPAVIDWLSEMIAIPSINPDLVPGAEGERALAEAIAARLRRTPGIDVELQDASGGRPNVIAATGPFTPSWTRSPCFNLVFVIAFPFTYVPYCEPTSLMNGISPESQIFAWLEDAVRSRSSSTTAQCVPRPISAERSFEIATSRDCPWSPPSRKLSQTRTATPSAAAAA